MERHEGHDTPQEFLSELEARVHLVLNEHLNFCNMFNAFWKLTVRGKPRVRLRVFLHDAWNSHQ